MAAGDPATKLRHLARQPEPVEMTTYKIWCLATTGGITRDLIEAMELVADLSWVTKVAESQPARLANINKFHPEYSLSTILSRTTFCQLNLLMPKPFEDEAVLARLEKQLAKLLTRNPRKSHGKAMFIKELFDLARENASAAKGKRVANLHHIIIKKAWKRWSSLPITVRHSFEAQAARRRNDQWHELENDLNGVRAEIAIRKARIAEEGRLRQPLWVSACPWGPKEMEFFSTFLKTSEFKDAAVMRRRAAAEEAPHPPSTAMMQELADQNLMLPPPKARPSWLSEVTSRRCSFAHTALAYTSGGEHHVVKFLYAKQNLPEVVVCARLTPITDVLDHCVVTGRNWEEISFETYRFSFKIHWLDFVTSWDLAAVGSHEIMVWPSLLLLTADIAVSDLGPIALNVFIKRCPPDATSCPREGGKPKKDTDASLMKTLPWLKDDRYFHSRQRTEESEGPPVILPIEGGDEDANHDALDDAEEWRRLPSCDASRKNSMTKQQCMRMNLKCT